MINLEEIKNSEGLVLTAYKRKGDVWTIGYGSTYYKNNTRVKQGDKITAAQAEELLHYKIEKEYLPQLKQQIKAVLNDNQLSALLSLIYNIGVGNLRRTKLLALINDDPDDEGIRLIWENTHVRKNTQFEKGLRARRKRETELYYKPADENEVQNTLHRIT